MSNRQIDENLRQIDDNLRICKDLVAKHAHVTLDDVYVVTYSYILDNFKATLATTRNDNLYYEVIYDVVKNRAVCANRVANDQNIINILEQIINIPEQTNAPESNQNIQEDAE